jgi:hypothetical protein
MHRKKTLDIISIEGDRIELGIRTNEEILAMVELTNIEIKHLIIRLVNLL